MVRRTQSFCTSELPSTTRVLDDYFNIDRFDSRAGTAESKTSETPDTSRVRSVGTMTDGIDTEVGGAVEEKGLQQVDGSSAGKTSKKAEKKKRQKKRKEREKEEKKYGRVNDVDEEKAVQVEHAEGEQPRHEKPEMADSNGQGAGRPTNVSGVFVVYGDRGVSQSDPQPEQPEQHKEQGVFQHYRNQKHEHEDGYQREHEQRHQESHENKLICRVHSRMLCQFNAACCVHKPTVECGCPPRASCCCIHHAGDCCYCRTDETAGVVTQDEDDSKTLSAAESVAGPYTPPTPPIRTPPPADNNDDAARTGGLSKAPITSPQNCSGVRVMVTPASPSPIKPASPPKMLGADPENDLAAQASLKLSNSLIEMMECNHMSDITLTLRSINDQFWPIVMTAHKCVLARSPLVTSLLVGREYYSEEITAVAGEEFIMMKTWELVVHYLYGKPIMTMETLKPVTLEALGYDPVSAAGYEPEYMFSVQLSMLDIAIGYAACGAFFYLTPIVDAGFGLAIDLLSWETVEYVLHCGLYTYKFLVVMPDAPWAEETEHQYEEPGRHTQDVGILGESTKASDAEGDGDATTVDGDSKRNTENAHPAPVPARNPTSDAIAVTSTKGLYPTQHVEADWSRRLVGASLDFVFKNMTPDFKLYSAAHSTIIPDRIPEFLKTSPSSEPPAQTAQKKNHVRKSTTQTQSHPPSAAVANNPRLADVKFGSFPSLGLEPIAEEEAIDDNHEKEIENQKSNDRNEPIERENKKNLSNCAAPDTPTLSSKKPRAGVSNEKDAPDSVEATTPVATTAPGLEVTIPSAILLTLGFNDLHLAFSIMEKRGILTSDLAREIILEREARRQAALKNYAAVLIAKARKENASGANPATAGDAGGAKKGKGRLKGKARKAQRQQKSTDGVDGADGVGKNTGDVESVSVGAVHVPDEVKELGYREFYSNKMVRDPREDGEDEVGVEIVLEREWVGFQY
ncbi:uncharacterized protein APUU_11032A [Aspergillus puulaauensis]|uniref:BTB domain-containing protein n=1 Tax=Aspergillus puulaauensis TaxID=1220207 RepID=A0A7R8AG36_9EURO|nr:uncharacterized protein APUU_11032A [Aspergillus puulaauensis]BCS18204.1 hypothetical protein APUU_11032A [Aspergillus puulaauensis]